MNGKITDSIRYIGVDDLNLELFENQYDIPAGISYNSYLIIDEKIAIMDTVDSRKSEEWWANLEKELNGKTPNYLVVSHMEPDHSGDIVAVLNKFPQIKIIASSKAIAMLPQFFEDVDFSQNLIEVKDGDVLNLGKHSLRFIMAPMVHWPEVMVAYEQYEKVLFSADAFGKFGALCYDDDWIEEARRYYINICGKYGRQVQSLLNKAQTLDINVICPLHGPILVENLSYYTELYNCWSSYKAETEGGVLIAYASIYGGTAEVANRISELLLKKGCKNVILADLCNDDMSKAVSDAFRMGSLVIAASSYDGSVFPPMYDFLHHLQLKNYQNRRVAIIENGSWAPCAGRIMLEMLKPMKDLEVIEPIITIRSRMKQSDIPALESMTEKIINV